MKFSNANQSQSLQNSVALGIQLPLMNNQYTIQNNNNRFVKQPFVPDSVKQPSIEVTQIKISQNQYPIAVPINCELMNSQQLVQGVPIAMNPLASLERNPTDSSGYGDNLRLQKYELEKEINNTLVTFIRHNKIAMVLMIILIVSYIIQIATQGSASSSSDKSNNGSPRDRNSNSDSGSSNSLSNNVYYFILDYLFWFAACIAAIKSKSNFNLKYINVYLGFMLFSFIPQVLGFADMAYRNNQNGETAVMVINIIACILEFLYKCMFGIVKALGVRALYQKHTSQYQGQQLLLYNKKQPNNQFI